MQLEEALATVAARAKTLPLRHKRRLIALAGPPAGGKSTLAEGLADTLPDACMVPMDGFHLDNRILDARGLRARKGAPESFDAAGFRHLVQRLSTGEEVVYPMFDRSIDRAIAGAGCVGTSVSTVVLEGNYLLLDAPVWRDLKPFWDLSVYLSVPEEVLRARLMERWRVYGFDEEAAAEKLSLNDLPNARTIQTRLIEPDLVIAETG